MCVYVRVCELFLKCLVAALHRNLSPERLSTWSVGRARRLVAAHGPAFPLQLSCPHGRGQVAQEQGVRQC